MRGEYLNGMFKNLLSEGLPPKTHSNKQREDHRDGLQSLKRWSDLEWRNSFFVSDCDGNTKM